MDYEKLKSSKSNHIYYYKHIADLPNSPQRHWVTHFPSLEHLQATHKFLH